MSSSSSIFSSESKTVTESKEPISALTHPELNKKRLELREKIHDKQQAMQDAKAMVELFRLDCLDIEEEIKAGKSYENSLKEKLLTAKTNKEIEKLNQGRSIYSYQEETSKETFAKRLDKIQDINALTEAALGIAKNKYARAKDKLPTDLAHLEGEIKAVEAEYSNIVKEMEKPATPTIQPIDISFNYATPLKAQACVVNDGYGEVGISIFMPVEKNGKMEFFPVPFYYGRDGDLRAAFADDLSAGEKRYILVSYNRTSVDIAPLLTIDSKTYVSNFVQDANCESYVIDGIENPLDSDGRRMTRQEAINKWGGECFTILDPSTIGPEKGTAEEQKSGKLELKIKIHNNDPELEVEDRSSYSLGFESVLPPIIRPSAIRAMDEPPAHIFGGDRFRGGDTVHLNPYAGEIARTGLTGKSSMITTAYTGRFTERAKTSTITCGLWSHSREIADMVSAKTRAAVDKQRVDDAESVHTIAVSYHKKR